MFFGSRSDIDTVMAKMRKDLLLKTTGHLSMKVRRFTVFLAVEFAEPQEAIIQPSMIMETLELQTCKSFTAAIDILKKVTNSDQVSPEVRKLYRRVVGQVLWLSTLRCGVMYAVKELSKGRTGPTGDPFAKYSISQELRLHFNDCARM